MILLNFSEVIPVRELNMNILVAISIVWWYRTSDERKTRSVLIFRFGRRCDDKVGLSHERVVQKHSNTRNFRTMVVVSSWTSLMAAENGYLEVCEILLNRGADVHDKINKDNTLGEDGAPALES